MKLLLEIVKGADNVSFGSMGSPAVTEVRGKSVRTATTPPRSANMADAAPTAIFRSDVPDWFSAPLCFCFSGLGGSSLRNVFPFALVCASLCCSRSRLRLYLPLLMRSIRGRQKLYAVLCV